MRRRRVILGVAAAGAYVAAALGLAGDGPVLPLYEGLPSDSPYRWVNPPPEFRVGNLAPESATQEVALTETGSVSASVVTVDGQGAIVVRENAFAPRLNEIAVLVTIEPLDPDRVGEPPDGARYDGNAYRITAKYQKDGSPAAPMVPGTVVLRTALGGTRLLRHQGAAGWVEISAQPVAASLQVIGETDQLGTFVAAQTVHKTSSFPWLPVSLGASAVAVGAAWFVAAHLRQQPPPARRDRRAKPSKGGRPSGPQRRKRR